MTAPALAAGRPPYRIPSMAEIAAMPRNGLRVVSLFSGAGGSCLGFRMAGFQTVWASEFVPAARDTYRANFPDVPLDPRDVRRVRGADVLDAAGLRPGDVDVLEGSPPCAAFSTSGKRARLWGQVRKYSDAKQRVDDLFEEYVRLVRELRPRAFVAENVAGLTRGAATGYFLTILASMRAAGYVVGARMLDAQWLGVPQRRSRVIVIGVRADLRRAPAFPAPLPYRYSIRDAIGDVGRARHVQGRNAGDEYDPDAPAPAVMAYGIGDAAVHQVVLGNCAIGRESEHLVEGQQSQRYFSLIRAHRDDPCPTLTAEAGNLSTAGVVHPDGTRKFTIAELRRLCGFPDDFVLTGTYAKQWERLGRAVPPPMMAAIGGSIARVLAGAPRGKERT